MMTIGYHDAEITVYPDIVVARRTARAPRGMQHSLIGDFASQDAAERACRRLGFTFRVQEAR